MRLWVEFMIPDQLDNINFDSNRDVYKWCFDYDEWDLYLQNYKGYTFEEFLKCVKKGEDIGYQAIYILYNGDEKLINADLKMYWTNNCVPSDDSESDCCPIPEDED